MALSLANELNEWAAKIHAHNVAVGWWDNNPSVLEKIHLITTEICEATEGARKDMMDDHLPHRKMEEVELADALIRTLDVGAKLRHSVELNQFLTFTESYRAMSIAQLHFHLVRYVCDFGNDIDDSREYAALVQLIITVAEVRGYDIMAAMAEKFEYNKHRADHKREARAQANGKKF